MPAFNNLILVGHMTKDPAMSYLTDNTALVNGGIGVNEGPKDKRRVLFLDFAAFGKTAEALQKFFHKGDAVLLQGRLQLDQWTDKAGNKRSKHKMVVDRWAFVGSKGDAQPAQAAPQEAHGEEPPPSADEEPAPSDPSIPF